MCFSDKIKLFRLKDSMLRNNDILDLEQIGMEEYFERLFYRKGELYLQETGYEHYYDKHYNAIVMTLNESDSGKKYGKNHIITRDLNISECFWFGSMVITSPITYVGRNRNAKNARLCYGIAIDLDGVGEKQLTDILHQQNIGHMPKAHLIVNSGNGVHLYFLFEEPIALFDESKKLLAKLKHALTECCWNMYTSNIKDKQIQGIFQGFRIPGTRTKFGEKVSCFAPQRNSLALYRVADLQDYGPEHLCLTKSEVEFLDKARYFPDKLSIKEAQERYPDWYERRIIRGEARERWHIKRDLYDWWLRRLQRGHEVKEGHRYFCIMTLSIYALKCDVSFDELKADALSLIDGFDAKTQDPENRFVLEDIEDALKAYQERYATFPRDTMAKITGITIIANKRNYRTQKDHLKRARAVQMVDYPDREWINKEGRPVETPETSLKAKIIREWRCSNPKSENKSLCAKETGLSRSTVRKWWDSFNKGE